MPRTKKNITTPQAELDVFSFPEISTAIIGENVVEYYPITSIVDQGPIQFDVPETFTQMTDPSFMLKVKVKIVKSDGTNLADDSDAAPTNLLLHSLFKDVVLKVNGVIVSQSIGIYPYRAYLETHYTYSSAAKEGAVGAPQMYYPETPGKFSSVTAKENSSYDKRKAKFAKSQSVELMGRLHCDLLMQDKLIIPGVKFSITLTPHNDKFRILTSKDDGKVKIEKATLKVRRVTLNSSMLLSIERSLQSKPATYPIMHATIRTAQVLPGTTAVPNLKLYSGQVPRLVIVTAVQTEGFQGYYSLNPFAFHSFNMTKAQVECNGRLFPPLPYDYKNSSIEIYLNSLRMVHKLYTDSSTGITYDDFIGGGNFILPFDLSPDDNNGVPARTSGVVTLNLEWETIADSNYTLIYYLLWDNVISIDSHRNVILDYIP